VPTQQEPPAPVPVTRKPGDRTSRAVRRQLSE